MNFMLGILENKIETPGSSMASEKIIELYSVPPKTDWKGNLIFFQFIQVGIVQESVNKVI